MEQVNQKRNINLLAKDQVFTIEDMYQAFLNGEIRGFDIGQDQTCKSTEPNFDTWIREFVHTIKGNFKYRQVVKK